MIMRIPFPIAQGYYADESVPVSPKRCVNFRPHIPQTQTITDGSLIGTEGIDLAVELPDSNRGSWEMNGIPYFVNGGKLYAVSFSESMGVRTYSYTDVSGSETIEGSAKVIMVDNGEQLCIVAPDANITLNAWIYTVAGGLVQVSSVNFRGPAADVWYIDGYFVFVQAESNVFFISDLRDGLTYISTDFASAESDPDPLVAVIEFAGLLYLFGSKTIEQWQDVGVGAGFPFVKAVSGNQNKGCISPLSLTEFNNGLIWIGGGADEQPGVWFTSGGAPVKISTPAVDIKLNAGGRDALVDAWAISWALNGRSCVAFTVPDVCTMEYDATTGLWYERQSRINGEDKPWRVSSLVSAYSVFLVGDSSTGNIGVMSESAYKEYDERIFSYFVPMPIENNGQPFTVDSVELLMETGTAPISGEGSDPKIRLAISDDFGRSYSPDITRDIGVTGEYENVIAWDLLGRYSRAFTPKFICDEPIKKVVVKGEIVISA